MRVNISYKINFRRSDKYVVQSNLNIQQKWENIRMWYKNNKFKISDPTWNEKSELPDESYSVSDI